MGEATWAFGLFPRSPGPRRICFAPREKIRYPRTMKQKDRVKLRFGPYRTPRFKYGNVVFCERAGEVTLCGLSSGRIPWPMCRRGKSKAIALVGDLVKAVRQESSVAIQHWWGVGEDTVWKWRKALGVGRSTEGTRVLKGEYANEPRFKAVGFATPIQ